MDEHHHEHHEISYLYHGGELKKNIHFHIFLPPAARQRSVSNAMDYIRPVLNPDIRRALVYSSFTIISMIPDMIYT